MPKYRDGLRIATNLFEAAAWHYTIKATCRACGHSGVFDPHALWWRFARKSWDDSLRCVPVKLRCTACRAGRPMIHLVREEPTVKGLEMPPEREWKHAVSRFRN